MPSLFTVVTVPNRITPPDQLQARVLHREQAATNNVYESAQGDPREQLPYKVFLDSRTVIRALEAWFDGIKGRYTSFYIPTYVGDITLVDDIGAADTSFDIETSGYADNYFPHAPRKHLCFITAAGTITQREVTAAVDNEDGTETLTIASSLGAIFPKETGLVSFRLLVRLDSDELKIERVSAAAGECVLNCIELPEEVA
jgi:hypothetical protein